MNTITRKPLPNNAKVLVVLDIVLSAWCLIDFTFGERHAYDLLGGIGFGLWAYGTYRNGFRKLPEAANDVDFSKPAYRINTIGFVLVVVSFAMRFWA
jgi:hypothetical protein